jgi:hypothetical protein
MGRSLQVWIASALVVATSAMAPPAFAQEAGRARVEGPAADALPGIYRLPSAHLGDRPRLGAVGWAGYGWIPGIDGEGGDHHRAIGAAALSIVPIQYLGIATGIRGAWDVHPEDAMGGDSSGVGAFWIGLRGAIPLPEGFAIGADVQWELNGADAPDVNVEASRLALRAIASLWPAGWDVSFDLALGYRLDGSARSVTMPSTIRPGDRVSLNASSNDSVLLGLGTTIRFAPAEIFGELTFEPYVGDGAADADAAPIRLGLGARIDLVDQLRAHVVFEATAHRRLAVMDGTALTPTEPRIALLVGLSFRPALDPDPVASEDEEEIGPDPSDDESVSIEGTVTGEDGPIEGASVSLEHGEPPQTIAETTTDADGEYRFEEIERQDGLRVRIRAEGYDESTREVELDESGRTALGSQELSRSGPVGGALRGLIRDFDGTPLEAEISISPGDHRARADAEGRFEVDLPPGNYEVQIRAQGYAPQRRRIQVTENEVVILNVDMRRARR